LAFRDAPVAELKNPSSGLEKSLFLGWKFPVRSHGNFCKQLIFLKKLMTSGLSTVRFAGNSGLNFPLRSGPRILPMALVMDVVVGRFTGRPDPMRRGSCSTQGKEAVNADLLTRLNDDLPALRQRLSWLRWHPTCKGIAARVVVLLHPYPAGVEARSPSPSRSTRLGLLAQKRPRAQPLRREFEPAGGVTVDRPRVGASAQLENPGDFSAVLHGFRRGIHFNSRHNSIDALKNR
jgi:hypothetical protein